MSTFGFEIDDLDIVEEDNYIPELKEETIAKYGDVFQLGGHRLMCGDSTNPEDMEKLMDGNTADMLLTDPPYNVDYHGAAGSIENDNMKDAEFRVFLASAFKAASSVMRAGAAFHIWHPSTGAYSFIGAAADARLRLRQVLIWVKSKATIGRQDFQWQHESCLSGEYDQDTEDVEACLYGWKDGAHSWFRKRREKTILYYDKPNVSKEHPTMKPVRMFDYEMKCNTNVGDRVLDIFGGSGTTIIAAEQNGRKAYVMELDPRFVDATIDRWEALTGQKAALVE